VVSCPGGRGNDTEEDHLGFLHVAHIPPRLRDTRIHAIIQSLPLLHCLGAVSRLHTCSQVECVYTSAASSIRADPQPQASWRDVTSVVGRPARQEGNYFLDKRLNTADTFIHVLTRPASNHAATPSYNATASCRKVKREGSNTTGRFASLYTPWAPLVCTTFQSPQRSPHRSCKISM
jgi:hypothetical protein